MAAGRGDRLGVDRPKSFAKLKGRPLLAESLELKRTLGDERYYLDTGGLDNIELVK